MSRFWIMLGNLFFVACNSSFFDPNTESVAITVAELTSVYLLRAGDFWAELEKNDGDVEWKDVVADVYLALRRGYKLSKKEEELVEKQVTSTLMQIKRHKEGILNGLESVE